MSKGNFVKSVSWLIFLMVAGCWFFGCSYIRDLSSMNEKIKEDQKEKTRKTEEAIKKEPVLEEMNDLCSNITKPEGFELVFKDKSVSRTENRRYFIVHQYSALIEYSKVRNFYLEYFEKEGWKIEEDTDIGGKWVNFRKDNYRVQIYYGAGGKDQEGKFIYGITCENVSPTTK